MAFKFSIKKLLIALTVCIVGVIEKLLNIKVYKVIVSRIGHLALNNDLFFKRVNAGDLDRHYKFILVGPSESDSHLIANKTLYQVIKKEAIKNQKIIFIYSSIIYKLLNASSAKIKESGIDIELKMHSNEVEFSLYDRVLYLSERDKRKGWDYLKSINIPNNKKIVCVFARDPVYLDSQDIFRDWDWSYHNYRNADIDTYVPTIKYLINLGYFVFRIGSIASKRVNYKNKYFLDYPFCDFQSDFMDIFLIDISEFLIGTTSGITDVATVFHTPFLGVNYAPFTESPLGRNDRFIQKKMIDEFGNVVKYVDALKLGTDDVYIANSYYKRTKLKNMDNTEEEILEATVEMELFIKGKYKENKEDKMLFNQYFLNFWKSNTRAKVKTRPCTSWLKKNIDLYVERT